MEFGFKRPLVVALSPFSPPLSSRSPLFPSHYIRLSLSRVPEDRRKLCQGVGSEADRQTISSGS